MEVGQIAPGMFPNVAKNHDPSPLECKKVTEWNMIARQNGHPINQQWLGMKLLFISVTSDRNQPSIHFSAISPVS